MLLSFTIRVILAYGTLFRQILCQRIVRFDSNRFRNCHFSALKFHSKTTVIIAEHTNGLTWNTEKKATHFIITLFLDNIRHFWISIQAIKDIRHLRTD